MSPTRLRRLALHLLMVLYLPLILLIVAALIALAVFVTLFFGFTRIGFYISIILDGAVLTSVGVLLGGLAPLFFRRIEFGHPGFPLARERHTRLFDLVERISKRVGARPPDEILLAPDAEASIADRTIRDDEGRVRRARTLVIGARWIATESADHFATILCHEMAHAAGGDTALGRRTARFFDSLQQTIDGHDSDREGRGFLAFLVYSFLLGYYYLFARLYLSVSRDDELRADRVSAEICGPQHARDLLRRVHAYSPLEELSIWKIAHHFVEHENPPESLYDEYRRRLANLSEARMQRLENEAFMQPTSPWSTHPPLAARFKAVSAVTAKEWTAAARATSLFTHWTNIEVRLSQIVFDLVRHHHKQLVRHLERSLTFR